MNTEQRGRRLRPVRRDAGQMRWTERDLVVLPWIGEQYAVRLDQLHALLSRQPLGTTRENGRVAKTTVRHCLERWRRAGVAQSMALVLGEPGWVWLTREGQRLAGLEYPFWSLSLSHLDHLYASNQAWLWVEAQEPEAWWRSARALRSEQEWVEARARLGHRPTAEVLIEGQARAVEVLTVWQQPQRVRAALPDLLARYSGCWYFVTPRAQPGLVRVLMELEGAMRARVRVIVLAGLLREQQHPAVRTPGRRKPPAHPHASPPASVPSLMEGGLEGERHEAGSQTAARGTDSSLTGKLRRDQCTFSGLGKPVGWQEAEGTGG